TGGCSTSVRAVLAWAAYRPSLASSRLARGDGSPPSRILRASKPTTDPRRTVASRANAPRSLQIGRSHASTERTRDIPRVDRRREPERGARPVDLGRGDRPQLVAHLREVADRTDARRSGLAQPRGGLGTGRVRAHRRR